MRASANLKQAFPVYRGRYLHVRDSLRSLARELGTIETALDLGSGEGDYDAMIAPHCARLLGCDVNLADLRFSSWLNEGAAPVTYLASDATCLPLRGSCLDLVISVDVIEHVDDGDAMVAEIARTLRPGGHLLLTCPNHRFPFTYDPLNLVLRLLGFTVGIGAYAYGHAELIKEEKLERCFRRHGLELVKKTNLSRHLSSLVELYWPGIAQRIFKANAANRSQDPDRPLALRPSLREPRLVGITDLLIRLDNLLFGWSQRSVGLGYLVRKSPSGIARDRAPTVELSIVIPVYDEERRLARGIDSVLSFVRERALDAEIVVVDDGSGDRTPEMLAELVAANRELRSVTLRQNRGKGAAVRAGVKAAQGRYVLFTDVDQSTPMSEWEHLRETLEAGAAVGMASRQVEGSERVRVRMHRFLMGEVFRFLRAALVVRGFNDTQCGFKLFTREAAADIFAYAQLDGWCFDVEVVTIAVQRGWRVEEVPVRWTDDRQTKVRVFRDSLRMLRDLFRIRRNKRIGLYD